MAKLVRVVRAPSPPPIESVTLELTLREAQVLEFVGRHVGGDLDGDRGKISAILGALRDADFPVIPSRPSGLSAGTITLMYQEVS